MQCASAFPMTTVSWRCAYRCVGRWQQRGDAHMNMILRETLSTIRQAGFRPEVLQRRHLHMHEREYDLAES